MERLCDCAALFPPKGLFAHLHVHRVLARMCTCTVPPVGCNRRRRVPRWEGPLELRGSFRMIIPPRCSSPVCSTPPIYLQTPSFNKQLLRNVNMNYKGPANSLSASCFPLRRRLQRDETCVRLIPAFCFLCEVSLRTAEGGAKTYFSHRGESPGGNRHWLCGFCTA